MNSLLFWACAMALLSFLRSNEIEKRPSAILKNSVIVLAGLAIFCAGAMLLRAFSPLTVLEIWLLLAVIFFAAATFLKQDVSTFAAVSGLSFWIPDYGERPFLSVFYAAGAVLLFLLFRCGLWSFQNKSMFYKTSGFFSGYPALMIQSFWASLILTALSLLFL